jgi:hypothetical protein
MTSYAMDIYRDTAISWTLYAMKNMLGLEQVRNKILKHFYPAIKNLAHSKTFDAFQPPEALRQYAQDMMTVEPYVVFTATNMAEVDATGQPVAEPETHYQSFYVDNIKKKIYAIDPARAKEKDGIYTPFVARLVLQPLFEVFGYEFSFIEMTHPAQSSTHDVFCQSWTLYILLALLTNGVGLGPVTIPAKQGERYGILLDFYKRILQIPTLAQEFITEYQSALHENKHVVLADGTEADYMYLQMMDPVILLKEMKKKDMY